MKNIINNLVRSGRLARAVLALGIILTGAQTLQGLTRVRDIARPLGERTNKLWGWGIVVGLNGKGDGGDMLMTARPLMTLMQKMGNPPTSVDELKNAKNAAWVMVTAELPRNGVRNGDTIDVKVACVGKASSLAGGILLNTPLISSYYGDNNVYAWAQGLVSMPDATNLTTGVVKDGAIMEMDFIYGYTEEDIDGRTYFDLILEEDQASWQVAHAVAMFIDDMITTPGALQNGEEFDNEINSNEKRTALALDPRCVRVYIPNKQADNPAGFISRVMRVVVDLPDPEATIVVNERTGTIAITGNVEIAPCSVTVTGMMIRIDPQMEQQQTEWSKFDTIKEGSGKLDDLVTALEQLNVPVKQKIEAIYALRRAGVLRARVIVE